MKKTILMLIMLLIAIPICLADAEMNVTVATDGDLDANIVEVAEGDITTDIHCYGASCTTNVNGGTINVPDNQSFEYNDYSSYSTTVSKSSGLSMGRLYDTLARVASDYFVGKEPRHKGSAWEFWEMLDYIFVSHREYNSMQQNMYYMGEQMDAVNAELLLFRTYHNVTWREETLECQTGIQKAKRIGMDVTTPNGWMVDLNAFGESCIKLQPVTIKEQMNGTR